MWNEEAKTLSCPSWLIVSEECSTLQYYQNCMPSFMLNMPCICVFCVDLPHFPGVFVLILHLFQHFRYHFCFIDPWLSAVKTRHTVFLRARAKNAPFGLQRDQAWNRVQNISKCQVFQQWIFVLQRPRWLSELQDEGLIEEQPDPNMCLAKHYEHYAFVVFWKKPCDLISSLGALCSPAKLQSAVTGAPQSNGWEAPGPMLRGRRMHHQWPGAGVARAMSKMAEAPPRKFQQRLLEFLHLNWTYFFFYYQRIFTPCRWRCCGKWWGNVPWMNAYYWVVQFGGWKFFAFLGIQEATSFNLPKPKCFRSLDIPVVWTFFSPKCLWYDKRHRNTHAHTQRENMCIHGPVLMYSSYNTDILYIHS